MRRRTLERTPGEEAKILRAVARAKQGDPEAHRYLYLRYANNVYGYVCSLLGDEHDAEDVTQLLFARLTHALQRYEPRVVPFSGWLMRLAHNAAIDHVRARRTTPCEEVRNPFEEDDSMAHERLRDLKDALGTLPDDQRDVVFLRFVLGLSPGEVAKRLGRTEHAIHGLQHRGRRALRAELTRMGAAPAALATT